MNRSDVIRALVLGAAVAASACARKEASGLGGTPSEDTAAATASAPAPWDPVDPQFKGCEGG